MNPVFKSFKSLILLTCLALVAAGCSGRTKTGTDGVVEATPLTNQTDGAVESAPMSFDPQGSDSGKISGLVTVLFDYDKANLSAASKKKLQQNGDWIKANPNAKVQIEGHCDARGSIEYNLALGERRANAVRAYLVSLGINKDRLTTISYGKEKPVVAGESEAAMAKNRRANFLPSN